MKNLNQSPDPKEPKGFECELDSCWKWAPLADRVEVNGQAFCSDECAEMAALEDEEAYHEMNSIYERSVA